MNNKFDLIVNEILNEANCTGKNGWNVLKIQKEKDTKKFIGDKKALGLLENLVIQKEKNHLEQDTNVHPQNRELQDIKLAKIGKQYKY